LLFASGQRAIVGEGQYSGVLRENTEGVGGRIASAAERYLGVGVEHRKMREAHLSQTLNGKLNQEINSVR
jgi:hypothetical protein